MRSIERIEGVSITTVARLLTLAGIACKDYHDKHVQSIKGKRQIQCDELWSFIYAKERQAPYADPWDVAGHAWTFTAIDADSKLLISYLIAPSRNEKAAKRILLDLTKRLEEVPSITADKLNAYRKAAKSVYGADSKKILSQMRKGETSDHNTAYVERHNLTIRMNNRRFNRQTNAFSKKLTKHLAMMHLFAVYYNFCRIHMTLRVSPAMEAGITIRLRDYEWIVGLIDAIEPKPKRPGPKKGSHYRQRVKKPSTAAC